MEVQPKRAWAKQDGPSEWDGKTGQGVIAIDYAGSYARISTPEHREYGQSILMSPVEQLTSDMLEIQEMDWEIRCGERYTELVRGRNDRAGTPYNQGAG